MLSPSFNPRGDIYLVRKRVDLVRGDGWYMRFILVDDVDDVDYGLLQRRPCGLENLVAL